MKIISKSYLSLLSTPNKDKFNVYDDIRTKLLANGIPEHEIAFIHDAETETKKKELFAKVQQGRIRVLLGSTFKMGSGTNIQDKLIAIHDADCPWRPADLAQRSGRIIRQGNKNAEVSIFRYATRGTFDSYLFQTVEKKQNFIAQIMSSKSPVRSCEDCDETALSFAEIKALCAGNPLIAEKMSLDNDVTRLRMIKSDYLNQRYRLEDSLLKKFPEQISGLRERIAGIGKDIAGYSALKEKYAEVQSNLADGASVSAKFPGMTIKDVTYSAKEPAAKALIEACREIRGRNIDLPVGEYFGFQMSLRFESFGEQINLSLRGAMTYLVDLGTDALGNITRINNSLDGLPKMLEKVQSQLEGLLQQQESAKSELEKPFSLEAELTSKEARLALLNADLNIDGDGSFDVENDPEDKSAQSESIDEDDEDADQSEICDDDTEISSVKTLTIVPQVSEIAYAKSKPSILDVYIKIKV
ncbi:hypothetical protein FACS1894219_07480 [Clostridia bacterium]|nr:hypothetical protein FACS1894219_07480 [Clostridia bacterium]